MAFVNLSELSSLGRDNKQFRGEYDLLITVASKDRKNKKGDLAIVFHIGPKLSRQYRIIRGDRVNVLFDKESRTGLIKRTTGKGQKIGGPTDGKRGALRVQLTFKPEMGIYPPEEGIFPETVTINDEGILFDVPESALDPKNLRVVR